jgi:hypothetical protein
VIALLIACIVSFAAIVRAGEPAMGWLDLGSAGRDGSTQNLNADWLAAVRP